MTTPEKENKHVLRRVYEQIIGQTASAFKRVFTTACKAVSALGDLTRDRSEKAVAYLKEDLHETADSIRSKEEELRDWLKFDVELVEDRLSEEVATMADDTRLALQRLAEEAEQSGNEPAGETAPPPENSK